MSTAPEAALARLREQILAAAAERRALRLTGGGTKDFLGRTLAGEPLSTLELSGILDYQPSELVVRVLAGTPLADLERSLAERGQMLAFEPPSFGPRATVGGMFAAGLSGPRRLQAGAVRDFVLGASLLDAAGRPLNFGGQVMKNVAGYDVSRLLCGSMGVLGLITEVSLKVLPRPAAEQSWVVDCDARQALDWLVRWGNEPLPISGTVWHQDRLLLRLSGARAAVEAAARRIRNDSPIEAVAPEAARGSWQVVREQRLPFFADAARPLWRVSLPRTAAMLAIDGDQLIEWGGALRWHASTMPAEAIRAQARAAGGSALLFRHGDRTGEVFEPLSAPVFALHQRLKAQFDPAGLFNPGRLYQGL
jgi:glycolate oxidase FAD binding subunit